MKNHYQKIKEVIDLQVEWNDKLEIDWSIVKEQVKKINKINNSLHDIHFIIFI